jgi:uncharacterized protein YajQ (UPF0234 family)
MEFIKEGFKSLLKIETEKEFEYWVMDLVTIAAKRDIVTLALEASLQTESVNVLVNDTRIISPIPYKRAKVLSKLIRDLLTSKGFEVA